MDITLNRVIDFLDVDLKEFRKNLLGILVETRCEYVMPEHILGALVRLADGFTTRKIRKQHIAPNNVYTVLKKAVENTGNDLPLITDIDNVPMNQQMETAAREILNWLDGQNRYDKIKERDLMARIVLEIDRNTIEKLTQFAILGWELFTKGLKWPPKEECVIQLWVDDPCNPRLDVEKAFDSSGRKLVSALDAEMKGLGLKSYTVEALFIALLNFESSRLDFAIRPQLIDKDARISDVRNLLLELRNSIRRPRKIKEDFAMTQGNFQDRLITVFAEAAEISCGEGRTRVSLKDITFSLVKTEAQEGLGVLLQGFGIDLQKVSDFLEIHGEEDEEDDTTLVPMDQLESKIKEKIIGQDHAVERILPLIKRLNFGYRRPGKPAGVFLFMGPSGTGKTQMAKVLADILYGSQDNMLMLEMGQFGTKESKSMFIGAAPGYVGYGEGKLTNGIRDNPETVILFDEVEKADPLVLDVLLRFLDEGKIDDPAGPVRDGSKSLIILTSNFLSDSLHEYEKRIQNSNREENEEMYRDLRKALLEVGKREVKDERVQKFFRPEFIFRIDEIILFRSFAEEDFMKIAEMNLNNEIQYIKKNYEIDADYNPGILEHIAAESMKRSDEGARVINRLINVIFVNPFIDFLAGRQDTDADRLYVDFDNESKKIKVSVQA